MAKADINYYNRCMEYLLDGSFTEMPKDIRLQIVKNNGQNLKVDDIVTCVYKKGFFKIYGFQGKRAIVSEYDMSGDFQYVSPKYLTLVDIDEKVMKVLYGRV